MSSSRFSFNYLDLQVEPEKTSHIKKTSFSLKNFRLLTSNLKNRASNYSESFSSNFGAETLIRPKTTPIANEFTNNFSNSRNVKTEDKLNVEKTLQRLNIKNYKQSVVNDRKLFFSSQNFMPRKKDDHLNRRKNLEKFEFLTLDGIKYNNYKYRKMHTSEKNRESRISYGEAKENNLKKIDSICDKEFIEKMMKARIKIFEKRKQEILKNDSNFYKSNAFQKSERLTTAYSNENKENKNNDLSEMERDLFILIRITAFIQKKLRNNYESKSLESIFNDNLEEMNKMYFYLKKRGDKICILNEDQNLFLGVILNFSDLFMGRNKIINDRIILTFGYLPRNYFDLISVINYQKMYSTIKMIANETNISIEFVSNFIFIDGGSSENNDEYEIAKIKRIFELLSENSNDDKLGGHFQKLADNLIKKSKITEYTISKNIFLNYISTHHNEFELLVKTIFNNSC